MGNHSSSGVPTRYDSSHGDGTQQRTAKPIDITTRLGLAGDQTQQGSSLRATHIVRVMPSLRCRYLFFSMLDQNGIGSHSKKGTWGGRVPGTRDVPVSHTGTGDGGQGTTRRDVINLDIRGAPGMPLNRGLHGLRHCPLTRDAASGPESNAFPWLVPLGSQPGVARRSIAVENRFRQRHRRWTPAEVPG